MNNNINKYIFRILTVLTLGSTYLPILFNNLPSPLHTPTFYLLIWVLLMLLLNPFFLFSHKSIIVFYIFSFIYLFSFFLFWEDRTLGYFKTPISIKWIFGTELSWPFLAILMNTYFLSKKDYSGYGLVTLFALSFILITSISSIYGLSKYPNATRLMTGSGLTSSTMAMFERIGIGNYGFFTSIAFLSPGFAYILKELNWSLSKKLVLLILIVISTYAIIKSQLTTTLLSMVSLFILPVVIKMKNLKFLIITIFIIILSSFFIFSDITASIFEYIGNTFFQNTPVLQERFNDLALVIRIGDFDPESTQTYVASKRLSKSHYSLISFFENPIIGGGSSADHAYWLDRLGLFGILGIFPWLLVFRNHINMNSCNFHIDFKPYFFLSFFSFIIFGLFKSGLSSPQIMISFFFLVPGISFLKDLKFSSFFNINFILNFFENHTSKKT